VGIFRRHLPEQGPAAGRIYNHPIRNLNPHGTRIGQDLPDTFCYLREGIYRARLKTSTGADPGPPYVKVEPGYIPHYNLYLNNLRLNPDPAKEYHRLQLTAMNRSQEPFHGPLQINVKTLRKRKNLLHRKHKRPFRYQTRFRSARRVRRNAASLLRNFS